MENEPYFDPEDFSNDEYREKIRMLDARDGIYWLDESPLAEERIYENTNP